jgi:hypothetical protein
MPNSQENLKVSTKSYVTTDNADHADTEGLYSEYQCYQCNPWSRSLDCREMTQSIVNAGGVWLNARIKCCAQKVHARKVRIDQQGVSFELELVTVRAEISHADAVARRPARIVHYELPVMIKSGTKRLRREYEPEKNAHVPRITSPTRIEKR